MSRFLLLIAALAAVTLVGCGEAAPMKDTAASVPRPAPGTPTKDVMIPSAKTGQ